MTNPLDELKELEARRAAVVADIKTKTNPPYTIALAEQSFDRRNKHNYRRLALEVAAVAENAINTADYFAMISEVIFSPSDPRVVVGREYEFSIFHSFENATKGVLAEITDRRQYPFRDTKDLPWTFIRELPKEERGES